MKKRVAFLIVLFFTCFAAMAQRQSIDALNAARRSAEAEIARIDQQLKKLEGSKKDASAQLSLVKERLSKRRDVLRSIDAQIAILDDRAREQSALATAHASRLDLMKVAYERMVRFAYDQSRQQNAAPMLMSVEQRAKSTKLQHTTSIVLRLIESKNREIRSIQGELGFELREIALRKEDLAKLKTDEARAVEQINHEKVKIERLTASIDKDEKSLTNEKSKRLKAIESLQKQVEAAIRREVEASKQSSSKGEKPTIDHNDPFSRAFVAAKGRMLPPVSPFTIVDTYGVHNHPTERGVKVDNKGVNLSVASGASVRSIAAGEVRKIFVVAGMGTSILVRHGVYLSVYSNLQSVTVAVGDSVKEGSVIGRVAADGILHFELWRETETLNPVSWVQF